MSIINISNVVNVSVMAPPTGLAPYSVNNLLMITNDVPVATLPNGYGVYLSAAEVAADWGSLSNVYLAAAQVFSQSPNIVSGGGVLIVMPQIPGESYVASIHRASGLVYFGGVASTIDDTDGAQLMDAATYCEAQRKLLFVSVSSEEDLINIFGPLSSAGFKQTRKLLHTNYVDMKKMKWSYASRAMSVSFAASNTTMTMQVKQLTGVLPDLGMTQNLLAECQDLGVDVYPSVAGRPSVLSHGQNGFFDDVYNLNWFVGALQVAGFNWLATTSTKVPQTEAGMDGLKGAYRRVCAQAVSNGFLAAGTWTSPDVFGNPQDFKRNIEDFGYYLYSQPVGAQSSDDRAQRKAPIIQIAVKYAGAIHKSDVLVYINQ